MKRNQFKTLRNKADKLLQIKYVILNSRCLTCGRPTYCMHHYIHKNQSSFLRYYPPNLIPVCVGCHCKIHQSQDPETLNMIVKIKGQKWADDLYEKRRTVCKMNVGYLRDIIKKLQ